MLALAAAVTFGLLWQQEESQDRAEEELRREAERFVTALTNFSADTIEQDAREIRSFAVGEFKDEADAFFGQKAIAAIKEADAASRGDIESLYVQSLEGDNASAFAVVTETVTNAGLQEGRTETLRLEVGMIKTESGWKVNKVDILQSPGTVRP